MSTASVSPQTFLGGTWSRIQDRFLLCAGSTYTAGNTGGSATHTLSVAEMPSHSHTVTIPRTSGTPYFYQNTAATNCFTYDGNNSFTTSSSGSGAAHNNMPPYLVVYCWTRTA